MYSLVISLSRSLLQQVKESTTYPTNPGPGEIPKRREDRGPNKYLYPMSTEVRFTITDRWKSPKHPPQEERIHELWSVRTMGLYSATKRNEVCSIVCMCVFLHMCVYT